MQQTGERMDRHPPAILPVEAPGAESGQVTIQVDMAGVRHLQPAAAGQLGVHI